MQSEQMSNHVLERDFAKVPVTALSFHSDHVLLTGEGPLLSAYDVDSKKRLATTLVFEGQAIHGIIKDPSTGTVIVYGGSLVAISLVAQDEDNGLTLNISGVTDTGDWILDAAFLPSNEGSGELHATLITAHNSVVQCSISQATDSTAKARITTETLVPGSNCILYCAHISWLSVSQCLIASGTAFGDIIVWSYHVPDPQDSTSSSCQTHFTFSAHEGSVFGVQISAPDMLDGCQRLLASCSDDRTVKVWDVSDLTVQSPTLIEIQRDTGFGSKEESNAQAPPLLAKAMGHISRIWSVRFVSKNGGDLGVVSFGEDATRISWDLQRRVEVAGAQTYALEQAHTDSLHSGKNIWATAMDGDNCATGGADGSIAIMPAQAKVPAIFSFDKANSRYSPEGERSTKKDIFTSYAFVGADTLVATTANGRIVTATLLPDGTSDVQSHGDYDSIRSFSMVTGTVDHVFIAGIGGSVYMWAAHTKSVTPLATVSGKTAGLFISKTMGALEEKASGVPTLLTTSVGSSTAELYAVRVEEDQHNHGCRHWTLDLGTLVVTSFVLMKLGNIVYAMLGARNGALAVYEIPIDSAEAALSAAQTIDDVHGKDAITCLHWRPTTDNDKVAGYMFSTGRDGRFAIHQITGHDGPPVFSLVHQLELPFGPNIEGLSFLPSDQLRVWGFKSKHFVVHDIISQQDVMTVECGGAHRNWAFEPSENGGTLVWTKASQVFRTTQTVLPHHSINSGGHGREIKALAVSDGKVQLIATGAEDTDIKIFTYDSAHKLRCLQTLRKHVAGIQHLEFSSDGSYLFSSGGFEEFFVWRITHNLPIVSVGVVCESKHPNSGTSDLRIMGFSVAASHAYGASAASFGVSMVYSDSTVKLWSYDTGAWELRASGDYLTACLTDVPHIPIIGGDSSGHPILTAATDGHLALWRIASDGEVAWQERRTVHQNAILDILQHPLEDGSQLIVTAGDDNGIGVTRLSGNGDVDTLLLPRAHAAAVTALAIKEVNDGRYWLLSASIDQRVKVWQVDVDVTESGVEGIAVKKVANVSTSVADVSSMSLIRLDDEEGNSDMGVLICGVGIEVWRLPAITK